MDVILNLRERELVVLLEARRTEAAGSAELEGLRSDADMEA